MCTSCFRPFQGVAACVRPFRKLVTGPENLSPRPDVGHVPAGRRSGGSFWI